MPEKHDFDFRYLRPRAGDWVNGVWLRRRMGRSEKTAELSESERLAKETKEQAENAYLDATDVKRAMTPPISVAVEARDDMLKDRFNYVSSTPLAHEP